MSTTTGYVCIALRNQVYKNANVLFNSAFIAGGLAACGAVTVTHGFETVKIRYGLA